MEENLTQYLKSHPHQGFKPLPIHNRTGDMLVWYWSDAEGYADPIYHNGVHVGSLIRSFKTKEIVGVKINNVAALLGGKEA